MKKKRSKMKIKFYEGLSDNIITVGFIVVDVKFASPTLIL